VRDDGGRVGMADITGWRPGKVAGRRDFQRRPTGGIEAEHLGAPSDRHDELKPRSATAESAEVSEDKGWRTHPDPVSDGRLEQNTRGHSWSRGSFSQRPQRSLWSNSVMLI
jgi:hypothetical protein